jgi:hypothetical protein
VGGLRAVRRRTFTFAAGALEPAGVPAHVPARMHHPRADIAVTTGPRVIGPGMAVLPPLPRMLFWLGYVALSGHDSTPWTYDAFSRRFGDRYRTLRAGEELRITAAGG